MVIIEVSRIWHAAAGDGYAAALAVVENDCGSMNASGSGEWRGGEIV
jgi:hypothetical protein